jgi:hypothetical protein
MDLCALKRTAMTELAPAMFAEIQKVKNGTAYGKSTFFL